MKVTRLGPPRIRQDTIRVGDTVFDETTLGGVTDHGLLTGLADDDHSAYVTVTGGGGETVQAHGNAGSTETVDPANGNIHTLTLDANLTLTLTGPASGVGCSILLKLTQDGTGGFTVTWPGSVVWPDGVAPTIDPTAGAVTFVTLFTTDGGTIWYGFAAGGGATIDYAETGDLAPVGSVADAGVSTEIPRADHVHVLDPDAVQAAGRWEHVTEPGSSAPPVDVYSPDGTEWVYWWV